MNEFLQQFLVESRELAEQATAGLLKLERTPQDAELLDEVFRAMHTLKGGAGIMDFVAMERAVHAAEDLLSSARAGRCVLDASLVGDCLACVDLVLQWLDGSEQSGELPDAAADIQADRMVARFASRNSEQPAPARPIVATGADAATGDLPALARDILAAQLALVQASEPDAAPGRVISAAVTASNVLRSCRHSADAELLADLGHATTSAQAMLAPLAAALQRILAGGSAEPAVEDSLAGAVPRSDIVSRTLRVDAERIDALVRLTGELTVARNALGHTLKAAESHGNPIAPALKSRHDTFAHLIGQLQQAVLALRVLPLRVVFLRFPRLLREMSEALGKPVQMKFSGEDTEADKAIVEMLFEPLLHVVRNAVDHGVESPALRAQQNKPPEAVIEMRATRQGNQVIIEVADDGAGMDVQRIRAVAVERGVATAQVLDSMTEDDVQDLVFAPGFSTAAAVTAISGRGVGMDAVRTAVERVGGRVNIHSRAGHGTTVRFMLPFSVMMTTVMSVQAGGQMFGVPLEAVVETIRVPRSRLGAVGTVRAVVVRDQTVPVFELAQMLGTSHQIAADGDATLVIASFAGQRCGLEVDALGERMDIILKPLDGLLAGTPGITGTTLLGDGRVLLVLDIAELLQ